ncbi:hypothetical protein [Reichenbachiella ulvae]|uniref:DUF4468 domain-containing protein n=1 Tax=Reichenbachiella ulvae TaxID=2980104 RepID=A0ABT3CYM0_9BACT|nr:hypothetical protein [Reichenbachiella ulvae]MCV9388643.1 hypothetical protein [Reichenbachiella ulvae]
MNLRLLLIAALMVFVGSASAQKLKVKSGNVKDLSSFKSYNMEYTYHEDLMVGKKTEEEYLEEKRTEKNADEAGTGDAWVATWNENKEGGKFFEKFETLFNDQLTKAGVSGTRDNADADCTLKMDVYYLDPGFNVGVMRRPAYVSMTATFVADGQEIAVIDLEMAPGQGAGGYDFDASYRISESFEKTGKTLGGYLDKKVY